MGENKLIQKAEVDQYIRRLFAEEDELLKRVKERIRRAGLPQISVQPEEGRFLQFLAKAVQARLVLEIGTLGGYSGIYLARALNGQGKLITLEMSPKHAAVAERNFADAGLTQRVELIIGDAHATLPILKEQAPFDLIFIDAEKPGYPRYLDWSLEHLRVGGIVAVHNALRHGSVFGARAADAHTEMMIGFNERFAREKRLLTTLCPLGDGMLVGVKVQ